MTVLPLRRNHPERDLAAYVLGALEPAEARDVARHLTRCPDCTAEAAGYEAVADVLAASVARPCPADLVDRVLGAARATPQDLPPRVARVVRTRRVRTALTAAVAASALFATGAYGWSEHQRAERAETNATASAQLSALVTDPNAVRVSAPVTGGGVATLVADPPRAALLAQLPPVDEGRTYQVWTINGPAKTPTITSDGLAPAAGNAGQSFAHLIDGVPVQAAIAISVEPAGGSDQPTTTPIVVLAIAAGTRTGAGAPPAGGPAGSPAPGRPEPRAPRRPPSPPPGRRRQPRALRPAARALPAPSAPAEPPPPQSTGAAGQVGGAVGGAAGAASSAVGGVVGAVTDAASTAAGALPTDVPCVPLLPCPSPG